MSGIQTAPGQVTIVKKEREWLGRHAVYKRNKWVCKKTGAGIIMVQATHTIWEDGPGPCAGSGTRTVFHMYCPKHQKEPQFRYGSPIHANELMEAANG